MTTSPKQDKKMMDFIVIPDLTNKSIDLFESCDIPKNTVSCYRCKKNLVAYGRKVDVAIIGGWNFLCQKCDRELDDNKP